MRIRAEQLREFEFARRREKLQAALVHRGFAVEQTADESLAATDANGRVVQLAVARDRSTTIRTSEGRDTVMWHDADGRLKRLRDPGGLEIRVEADAADRAVTVERVGYGAHHVRQDEQGRIEKIGFPDGTEFRVEREGLTRRVIDRAGATSRYESDVEGRLIAFTNGRGHTTRFDYGEGEHARRIAEPSGTTHEFEFDQADMLTEWRVNGRVHARYSLGDEEAACTVRYADGHERTLVYDSEGRVIEARNAHSILKLEYDSGGRLLSEDQGGKIVRYAYDPTGQLLSIETPEGEKLRFERDGEGRLVRIFDWSGRPSSLEYLPGGALGSVRFPNQVTTTLSANRLGLPTSVQTVSGTGGRTLLDFRLAYDACDRLTAFFDGRRRSLRSYDAEGRLVGVSDDTGHALESFALDAAGNCVRWRSEEGQDQERVYDPSNRIVSAGSDVIAHDALGNVLEASLPRGRARLQWNGQGQLIAVGIAGQNITYRYDALGRRIEKRAGETVTRYVWAGATLLSEECSGKGAAFGRRDHLFVPPTFHPFAMRVDGKVYYQHVDHVGTPWCVSDESGEAVWQANVSPFGTARIVVSQVENPWRLANQYFDDETGLHYNLARYYHPGWGRYLSPDPLRSRGGGWNYYLYALGDPVNKGDPTGEIIPILIAIGVGMVIGAAIGAGMEAWKQRSEIKEGKRDEYDSDGIIAKAFLGGFIGAVGAAIGAIAAVGAGAALGVTAAVEGGTAALSTIMGIGAIEGIAGSVAEACVEAGVTGETPSALSIGISVVVGGVIGSISAGVGGWVASKFARKAAKEMLDEGAGAAEEAGDRFIREGATETVEAAAKRNNPEVIALGLSTCKDKVTLPDGRVIEGARDNVLSDFAKNVDGNGKPAATWTKFEQVVDPVSGLTDWGATIKNAMKDAKEIHFNREGMTNFDEIVKNPDPSLYKPPSTNWELATLLSDPELAPKVKIYDGPGNPD